MKTGQKETRRSAKEVVIDIAKKVGIAVFLVSAAWVIAGTFIHGLWFLEKSDDVISETDRFYHRKIWAFYPSNYVDELRYERCPLISWALKEKYNTSPRLEAVIVDGKPQMQWRIFGCYPNDNCDFLEWGIEFTVRDDSLFLESYNYDSGKTVRTKHAMGEKFLYSESDTLIAKHVGYYEKFVDAKMVPGFLKCEATEGAPSYEKVWLSWGDMSSLGRSHDGIEYSNFYHWRADSLVKNLRTLRTYKTLTLKNSSSNPCTSFADSLYGVRIDNTWKVGIKMKSDSKTYRVDMEIGAFDMPDGIESEKLFRSLKEFERISKFDGPGRYTTLWTE